MTAWQRLCIVATSLRHVCCGVLFHLSRTNCCYCLTFLGPLLLTSLPITSQMCSKGLRSGERDGYGRTFTVSLQKRHCCEGGLTGRTILHQAHTPVTQITMYTVLKCIFPVQICAWILAKKSRHYSLEDKTRSRQKPSICYTVCLQYA